MKLFVRSLLATLLALCAGCSSFDTKWRAAEAGGRTRWDGRWTSEHHKTLTGTPMGGRLRCVLEPVDKARVLAHFHANWLAFSGDYSVALKAKRPPYSLERGATVEFTGTHELPKIFGGMYQYDARISGEQFTARYTSTYDRGRFEMTRQLTNPPRNR